MIKNIVILFPSDRAEPDGIENEDDYQHKHSRTHKDSLEGAYDHSKEYDPFEVRNPTLLLDEDS